MHILPYSKYLIEILLSNYSELINSLLVASSYFSNNEFARCNLIWEMLEFEPKFITYRSFKHFNEVSHHFDLKKLFGIHEINYKVDKFNSILLRLFDINIANKFQCQNNRFSPIFVIRTVAYNLLRNVFGNFWLFI